MHFLSEIRTISHGLALAICIALVAYFAPDNQQLVFAILLGTAFNTIFGLAQTLRPGVGFAAKPVLEAAIVLLGASISAADLSGMGWVLILGAVGAVVTAIPLSYLVGRVLGLPTRLAMLVACGNSICGNSAIVAAAPVIRANADEVTAAIAFTAGLGIAVVLLLPYLGEVLRVDGAEYGILAGMTVYAVPQVLAATAPVGLVSAQVGTLVKLTRVLMLGPVVLALGLLQGRNAALRLSQLLPWFVVGFLGMIVLRNLGAFPVSVLSSFHTVSEALTLVAMAGLGLLVDLRSLLSSGGRVLAAGAVSLAGIGALAMAFILMLR